MKAKPLPSIFSPPPVSWQQECNKRKVQIIGNNVNNGIPPNHYETLGIFKMCIFSGTQVFSS